MSAAATPSLAFADVESLLDFGTYASRARVADPDGAIRLVASGTTLAAWAGVLPGTGLTGAGACLGLRVFELAEPSDLDVTIATAAITDRMARRAATGDVGVGFPVPPSQVFAAWSGNLPPRSGWEAVEGVTAMTLRQAAKAGIAEIAQGAPAGSGAAAVADLRSRVWSRPLAEGQELPAGVAFVAQALGFLPPSGHGVRPLVYASGRWRRVTLPGGHVLAKV